MTESVNLTEAENSNYIEDPDRETINTGKLDLSAGGKAGKAVYYMDFVPLRIGVKIRPNAEFYD